MSGADTIYALSSGALPSGVAVIRISGPRADSCLALLDRPLEAPGQLTLRNVMDSGSGDRLDTVLACRFEAPHSFTGEDIVELHCHGGVATVDAVLSALGRLPGYRSAEAGEFTQRAFENGKLDLTEAEGLADLIAAQTQVQRQQAQSQASGRLRSLYEGWRCDLIALRAMIEADLDFADEDDVPDDVTNSVRIQIENLYADIRSHLEVGYQGEIVRRGFRVALAGPPNAGKSSLLNALAGRDVAIVSPTAGTTRDVLEVQLDLGGHLVRVFDTAGLHESDDDIEREGMRRARSAMEEADLVLWLAPTGSETEARRPEGAVSLITKADLLDGNIPVGKLWSSTVSASGIEPVIAFLKQRVADAVRTPREEPVWSRQRHQSALNSCVDALISSMQENQDIELTAEHLRAASHALGRITGQVDVEDILDVIFSQFCIGK